MTVSLKAARVNAGLTQKDAAARVGVSERTLNKWENGKSFPTIDRFIGLCHLYGVQTDDICLPNK